jgi:hypothetical protein
MYIQRNIVARSRNHICRGKALRITHAECMSVALASSMQGACAVLYYHVACLTAPYFSTSSNARHDFMKKNLLNTKCVLIFSINL